MAIFRSKLWAILEPILLLVVLGLLAKYLTLQVGIPADRADEALLKDPPDWRTAADIQLQVQATKWGLLICAAWLLSRMRGYKIIRPVGGNPPALSFFQLVLFGLAVAIPLRSLALLPRWYHYNVESIGETPVVWDILYNNPWTIDFWIFAALTAFAFVPIVEELFFRGYALGNLNKRFTPAAAIFISGVIFSIVHLQYIAADLFALYNLLLVFFVGAAYAWTVFHTRSLLPAIAGHAYGNTPTPLDWAPYEAGLIILSAAILIWLVPKASRLSP